LTSPGSLEISGLGQQGQKEKAEEDDEKDFSHPARYGIGGF